MALLRLLVVEVVFVLMVLGDVDFTNLKCKSFDEQYATVPYCYLKSVNRTYKYGSVRINLHQLPITNIKINFELMKRANGYKPFLYNMTVDFCKFLRSQKRSKFNPAFSFFFELMKQYSNIDHPCPFNHDIFVEKANFMTWNTMLTKVLPFPDGDYRLLLTYQVHDKSRGSVDIYLRLY